MHFIEYIIFYTENIEKENKLDCLHWTCYPNAGQSAHGPQVAAVCWDCLATGLPDRFQSYRNYKLLERSQAFRKVTSWNMKKRAHEAAQGLKWCQMSHALPVLFSLQKSLDIHKEQSDIIHMYPYVISFRDISGLFSQTGLHCVPLPDSRILWTLTWSHCEAWSWRLACCKRRGAQFQHDTRRRGWHNFHNTS